MGEPHGIRRLRPAELDRAALVLAAAFDEDPVFRELFPGAVERRHGLTALWSGLVRYGRRYGVMLTTDEVSGVAVWFPPGRMDLTFARMLGSGFVLLRAVRRLPREARTRVLGSLRFLEGLEREQMDGRPYWYLWALAVEPTRQGRGLGTELLGAMLRRADHEGLPEYLETFNERDLAFYERSGFRAVRQDAFPRSGLPVWTLIREPRPAGA